MTPAIPRLMAPAGSDTHTAPPRCNASHRRRNVVIACASVAVVAAAVIGGVYGSRAAQRQRQRQTVRAPVEPYSAETDTYNALVKANTVQVEMPVDQNQQPLTVAPSTGNQTDPQKSEGGSSTGQQAEGGGGSADDSPTSDTPSPNSNNWQDLVSDTWNNTVVRLSGADGGWKALAGASGTICKPTNGRDLIDMVSGSTCTVIVLVPLPSPGYAIDRMMNVTGTKIVIGNPIALPAINASKVERLFDVQPGGRLDLRFVRLYRGGGVRLQNNTLRLLTGGSVRVLLGGHFTATGTVFTDNILQTPQVFLQELQLAPTTRIRTFGGHILVLGGNLYLQGCRFVTLRPFGNPFINTFNVGNQILVVKGNCLLVGTYILPATLWQAIAMVGQSVAVLGGTLTWVGGGIIPANGIVGQWGTGTNVFIGGGVFITIGFQFATASIGLLRAAFGEYTVGGGVYLNIGFAHTRAWAVGTIFGLGQQHAVGAGIFAIYAGSYATTAIAAGFFGLGGTSYVGTGHMSYVLSARINANVVLTQNGMGFNFFNAAGTMNLIRFPTSLYVVARFAAGLATESAIGAGWGNFIASPRFTYQLVNVFFGKGSIIWVGAGGAFFKDNQITTVRFRGYSNTPYVFTVAGTGVTAAQSNLTQVVTERGINRLNGTDDRRRHRYRRSLTSIFGSTRSLSLPSKPAVNVPSIDRVLLGQGDGGVRAMKAKLIMINNREEEFVLDPSRLDLDRVSAKALDSWAELMASQGDTQGYMRIFKTDEDKQEQVKPWMVSANNTDECFICGSTPGASASHYAGPDQCNIHDDCKSVDTREGIANKASLPPVARWALKHDYSSQAEADAPHDVPDTAFSWHELVAYCKGGVSTCVKEADVKAALRETLDVKEDYALAVASTAFHSSITHLLTPELVNAEVPEERSECPVWSKFNVYTTTNDVEAVDALRDAWKRIAADGSNLHEILQNTAQSGGSDAELCSVALKNVTSAVYPTTLDRMPAFNPATMGAIGPSATVAAANSLAPLDELVVGQEYKMYLQNFPKDSDVVVELRQALAMEGKAIKTVKAFPDDGTEDFVFTPDELGRYYLHAYHKKLPVIFAFSGAFDVVETATHPGRRW